MLISMAKIPVTSTDLYLVILLDTACVGSHALLSNRFRNFARVFIHSVCDGPPIKVWDELETLNFKLPGKRSSLSWRREPFDIRTREANMLPFAPQAKEVKCSSKTVYYLSQFRLCGQYSRRRLQTARAAKHSNTPSVWTLLCIRRCRNQPITW